MKLGIPQLLAGSLLLLGMAGCATQSGNVQSRISQGNSAAEATLECLRSSSGTCHFMFGEHREDIVTVSAGDARQIPAPAATTRVCVSFDPKVTTMCNLHTVISGSTETSTYSGKADPAR